MTLESKYRFVDWLMVTSGAVTLGTFFYWLFKGGKVNGNSCTEDLLRAKVVEAAQSQVGKADLPAYLADAAPQYVGAPRPEWCGIFALWCLHQAGLAKSVQWKTALGFVEPQRLAHVSTPKPGDIAYYAAPFQHHAVVAAVRGDVVDTVNGNGSGGVVSLGHPELSKATAYYSIQKFVDAAIAEGCK